MPSLLALSGWQLDQFLLATSLRAAAVLAAACCLSLIFSLFRTSAASRHTLWTLAVGGALGVPFLFGILPSCNIALPWSEVAPSQVAIELTAADPNLDAELLAWTATVENASPQSIQPAPDSVVIGVLPKKAASISALERADLHTTLRIPWLFLTWLTGACLAIVPTCLGLVSLWRLGRNSQTVTSGPLFVALQRATRQLATQRPVRLLTSAERSMPMTWGFWRPTILLPTVAESWSGDRLQIVLLHELAHVERGDCLLQIMGQIARTVYWFNPLAWIAVRQLRIEQEQACDDFVLCRGFNAPDYAEHLLAVSSWCSPVSGYSLALAMARPSKLERRLVSILNPRQNRHPLSRGGRRLVAALAIAITSLVSATHFKPAVAGTDDAAIQKAADNGQAAAPAKPIADRAKTLADLRSKIAEQYVTPVNENEIVQGAIKGMIGALHDPYSDYLTPESLADIEKQIAGSLTGIGAHLEMHEKHVRVVTPLAGSPALRAGIQPGDVIIEIDGQPTAGLELTEVVKRIVGPLGTSVRLRIGRDTDQKVELNVTREAINLPTVKGIRRAADNSWDFVLDAEHKLGYVSVVQFGATTVQEMRAAIESLKQRGEKGLILDLRFCPGGTLEAAVGVAKLFLSSGTIVTLHSRGGESTTIKADAPGAAGELPVMVLVNGQTASAAEVLAGALQDNQRAVVLGTRTVGKGSVQTLIKLDDGSGAIKLTTAQYRLPSGRNIDKRVGEKSWGIDPDDGYVIPLESAQTKALLAERQKREIIGKSPAVPADDKEHDAQLAAAIRSLTAKLQTGTFAKVSTLSAAQIEQFLRRDEIERRRESAAEALAKIDRELADLKSESPAKN